MMHSRRFISWVVRGSACWLAIPLMGASLAAQPIPEVHQVSPPSNPFLLELIGLGFSVDIQSSTGAVYVNGTET